MQNLIYSERRLAVERLSVYQLGRVLFLIHESGCLRHVDSVGRVLAADVRDVAEHVAESVVVGALVEFVGLHLSEVLLHQRRVFAEGRPVDVHFGLHDLFELALLVAVREVLPGETGFPEVDEQVAHRLEIVPTTLFDAQVGIHRDVPGCPHQAFVLPVGHVLPVH